jgi:Flp pilus assembly protein TadD
MTEALLQNALRLHQSGDLERAARIYREVLHIERRNFRALYLLGFVHSQKGEFGDAERLIGEALLINPRAADAPRTTTQPPICCAKWRSILPSI